MKDFERKIKDSKIEIIESKVNNPKELYQKAINKTNHKINLFNRTMIIRYAMILLMLVTITISGIAIYKSGQELPPIINQIVNIFEGDDISDLETNEIIKLQNINQIKKVINTSKNDLNYEILDEVIAGEKGDLGDFESSSSGNPGSLDTDREYQTNVQEENVDEADIVKVNGNYIYYIPYTSYSTNYSYDEYSVLYILKVKNDTVNLVKKINFATEEKEIAKNSVASVFEQKKTNPMDLFYTDDYIILRLHTTIREYVQYGQRKTFKFNESYTEFIFYDIKTYEQVKNIKMPGNYVSSRLINNDLYIVSNYSQFKSNGIYLPRYYINDELYEAKADNIYYCPGFGSSVSSYVIVFKVKINDNFGVEQFYFLSPSVNKIYMTENSLYLLKTYNYKTVVEGNIQSKIPTTKIIVINIKHEMYAEELITVKGRVDDEYWIDEYNGYLRIASTGIKTVSKLIDGKYVYDSQSEVFNYITIFSKNDENKWEEISSIKKGLGLPGETMRSARFEKNTATIVTFKQTDPLYYVDLTDPYNPKITSELKIEGFTVYQHPYKENYVIGIGYDATSSGSLTGYKVALFDISDKNNIKQVGESIIFDYYYSNLQVLSNPKAILLDLENDIFGFSIVKYENSNMKRQYFSEYYTFKIDLERKSPLYVFNKISFACDNYMGDIDRMVFIKDKYYLLATNEVRIYQLTTNELKNLNTVYLSDLS